MTQMTKMNQKGATLLELVMAVGIIAIIAIAAISFFNNASEATKSNELTRNIGALTGSIRNQYSGQGDYNGITPLAVKKGTAFPSSMDADRTTADDVEIQTPWLDDAVTILPENLNFTDDGFSLDIAGLPDGACTDVATRLFFEYDSVEVPSGSPVASPTAAAEACSLGGFTNSVKFYSH